MNQYLIVLVFNLAGVPPINEDPAPIFTDQTEYRLVWEDNFDGSEIDPSKWEHEVNCWGGGNNELQCYTDSPKNSFVKDGMLHIVALKETTTGRDGKDGRGPAKTLPYSSARLRTKGLASWKYGKICARAQMPYGQGMWPAIWMLPESPKYIWAADGEIDIMEVINLPKNLVETELHGSIHFGGEWPNNTSRTSKVSLPPDEHPAYNFNEYCIEWSEGKIDWFVNGRKYGTKTEWYSQPPNGDRIEAPTPFNEPFHLLLNVAVGGNWPGAPDASTEFPQKMLVDWVRVYQK